MLLPSRSGRGGGVGVGTLWIMMAQDKAENFFTCTEIMWDGLVRNCFLRTCIASSPRTGWGGSESIEWFIEDQASLRMCDLAPLPNPSPPLPSASWLGYDLKIFGKSSSLAYGFSFFVISNSGSSSCTRTPVASVPAIVGDVAIEKQCAGHVSKVWESVWPEGQEAIHS